MGELEDAEAGLYKRKSKVVPGDEQAEQVEERGCFKFAMPDALFDRSVCSYSEACRCFDMSLAAGRGLAKLALALGNITALASQARCKL